MTKTLTPIFRTFILAVALILGASIAKADEPSYTPEFAAEGIAKAVECITDMGTQINALETMDEAPKLETIVNNMKFRNVRKKYGKIQLTDEDRKKLLDANLFMAKAMLDYMQRAGFPFEVQQALSKEMTEENITKEINNAKTLKEALS